jgi:uncharacterized coiled-coil DUF342 family protein
MREVLLQDREFYVQQMRELNSQIRQLTANANCVKGALDYINLKIAEMETKNASNTDQHPADLGAESVGGDDAALLVE